MNQTKLILVVLNHSSRDTNILDKAALLASASNAAVHVEIAATAEAMESALRAGLDLDQVADALARGAAGSFHVGCQARIMAEESYAENLAFTTDLRRKDLRYGVEIARDLGVASRLGDLILAQFDHASVLGFGAQNESHVLDAVRDQSKKCLR